MGAEVSRVMGFYSRQYRIAAGIVVAAAIELYHAEGCLPGFPDWLLSQGDQAVLVAPEGNFAAELARMDVGRARVRAVTPETAGGYVAQSIEAELTDLHKALKQAKTPDPEISRICSEHERQRSQLAEFVERQQGWKQSHSDDLLTSDERSQTDSRITF